VFAAAFLATLPLKPIFYDCEDRRYDHAQF
jgi:hypothetical protein